MVRLPLSLFPLIGWLILTIWPSLYGYAATGAHFAPVAAPMPLSRSTLSEQEQAFLEANPVIRVAIPKTDFPPFQFINQNNEIAGGNIEVLQTIANLLGLKLEAVILDTWPEVLEAVQDRRADLIADITYTVDRDDYLDYTVGISPNPAGIIGRKSDDRLQSNPSLSGLKVSVGRGHVAEQYLKLQFPEAIVLPVDDIVDAVDAVTNNRADFYFGEFISAARFAERSGNQTLEIKRQVFYESGWSHFAIREDWKPLTNVINRTLSGNQALIRQSASSNATEYSSQFEQQLTFLKPEESVALASLGTIRVGAVRGLQLLNSVTEEGIHTGIAAEFMSYVSHKLGIPKVPVAFDTVADMITALREGRIDVIPFFTPSEARRSEFAFSEPYLEMPYILLGKADGTLYWDLESLAGKTLALATAHPLLPILARDFPKINILEVENGHAAVSAVARGQADGAVEVKLFANSLINAEFAGRVRALGDLTVLPAGFAFATRLDSPLIPVIDRALAEMPAADKDRALRRWVAVDLEPERQLRKTVRILVPTALGLLLLAMLVAYWNRRLAAENRRRLSAEQRLVDMTDRLRTGVFQFRRSPDGRIKTLFANATAKQLSRVDEERSPYDHRGFFDWVHPEEKAHITSTLERSLSTGEPFRESFRFTYPTGEAGWIIAEATSRPESDGSTVWSGYLFDLTAERRLTEQLDKLLIEKDRFLAIAGHELRTPVSNAALAFDQLLSSAGELSNQSAADTVSTCLESLSEMIGDLLDLSRAESSELKLTPKATNLRQLIRTIEQSFRVGMNEKGLSFSTTVRSDVPDTVLVDPTRLRQILYNLIGNSQKYTDVGSVKLQVSLVHSSDGSLQPNHYGDRTGSLSIAVEDTGLGIPPDKLTQVFEPFAMVGPADRRSTGLGLAVVKRIVHAMGGKIDLKSTEAVGSVFTVVLPLVMPTADAPGARATSSAVPKPVSTKAIMRTASRPPRRSTKLLLVDDDRLGRVMLGMLLRNAGLSVDECESGETAIQRLKQESYSAVLSDFRMPGMNGKALFEHIQRESEITGKPRPLCILMTADTSNDTHDLTDAEIDAILAKPVSPTQISQLLNSLENSDLSEA